MGQFQLKWGIFMQEIKNAFSLKVSLLSCFFLYFMFNKQLWQKFTNTAGATLTFIFIRSNLNNKFHLQKIGSWIVNFFRKCKVLSHPKIRVLHITKLTPYINTIVCTIWSKYLVFCLKTHRTLPTELDNIENVLHFNLLGNPGTFSIWRGFPSKLCLFSGGSLGSETSSIEKCSDCDIKRFFIEPIIFLARIWHIMMIQGVSEVSEQGQ